VFKRPYHLHQLDGLCGGEQRRSAERRSREGVSLLRKRALHQSDAAYKILFANAMAGQGSLDGAYFTTDSTSEGPNDTADWSGSTYFGGAYSYWTDRVATGCGGPTWGFTGGGQCWYGNDCYNWTYAIGDNQGIVGNSGYTDVNRYNYATWLTCDLSRSSLLLRESVKADPAPARITDFPHITASGSDIVSVDANVPSQRKDRQGAGEGGKRELR
jgi:hypothetical protein